MLFYGQLQTILENSKLNGLDLKLRISGYTYCVQWIQKEFILKKVATWWKISCFSSKILLSFRLSYYNLILVKSGLKSLLKAENKEY